MAKIGPDHQHGNMQLLGRLRIYRGYYIINPILEIGIGDEWYSYYDHFLRLHELEATGIPNISAMLRLMPQYKTAIAGFLASASAE